MQPCLSVLYAAMPEYVLTFDDQLKRDRVTNFTILG